MVLMWAAGAAMTGAVLGLPLLACLLVGAAIAPTDPVLSAPILTGRLARVAVPDGLRDALTAESGINDGLALPLVMLPVLLLQHPPAEAWAEWFVHVLLWEIGAAVLAGLAAGWFVGHGLRWARRRPEADKASLMTVTLALAVAPLAGVRVLGGDGILAALVAGAVLNNATGMTTSRSTTSGSARRWAGSSTFP